MDSLISSPAENRRFWVVRADGGKYFQHFSKYGVVALGHIDNLKLPPSQTSFYKPDLGSLKESLAVVHKNNDKSTRHSTNHYNQVRHFIYDMKVGDWVVTVGNQAIQVGRVLSDAYISNKKLDIIYDIQKDKKLTLDMALRRDVAWGPKIAKTDIPYGVARSLMANQTMFCIDEHWEALYHMLFPVFCNGEDIYFTIKIKQKDNIKNFYVAKILDALNELEVLTNIDYESFNLEDFQSIYNELILNEELFLTTKAQFHSPGDILGKLSVGKGMGTAYLIYSMMFGNSHLGIDGVLDLESRQKIVDVVISRIEHNNLDLIKQKLDIQQPNYDTSVLDDESSDVQSLANVKN